MEFSESDCSDSDVEFELYSQIHYNSGQSDVQTKLPKCKKHGYENEDNDNSQKNNLLNWLTILKEEPFTKCQKPTEKRVTFKEHNNIKNNSSQNWEVVVSSLEEQSSSNDSGIMLNINGKNALNTEWDTPEDDLMSNVLDKRRYYSPKSEPRCKNCDLPGHIAVACHKPKKLMPCYLCAQFGHFAKLCKEFKSLSSKSHAKAECKRCGQFGHKISKCPDVWRQYHLTVRPGKLVTSVLPGKHAKHAYCFNCSKKGHFGNQCNRTRYKPYFDTVSSRISKYDKSPKVDQKTEQCLKTKKLKRRGFNGFHRKAKMQCV